MADRGTESDIVFLTAARSMPAAARRESDAKLPALCTMSSKDITGRAPAARPPDEHATIFRVTRRLVLLLVPLLAAIFAVSGVALETGVNEARLIASGPRHDLTPEELASARGWIATYGCVRHDLAVGVGPSGRAYRLGRAAPETEHDLVFTPLAARDDCEDAVPRKLFLLIEDDDALGSTIANVYRAHVAPPPVSAFVSGVVGYGAGHGGRAAPARALLTTAGVDVAKVALLAKGKQPGVLWVALVTAAAGAHGFLLCGIAVWWAIRRERRRRDRAQESEEEQSFFDSETLED